MRNVLLAAVAVLSMIGSAVAADLPNFSGEWKMNPSKSNYSAFPPPSSFVRKITQKDPSITIVEEQTQDGNNSVTTRPLTTDGKAATLELNGASVVCSATWEGKTLIATSVVDAYGITFRDRMTLSDDGKVLTSEIQVLSSQGDAVLLVVFDKQ